jgi:hypothetical protein
VPVTWRRSGRWPPLAWIPCPPLTRLVPRGWAVVHLGRTRVKPDGGTPSAVAALPSFGVVLGFTFPWMYLVRPGPWRLEASLSVDEIAAEFTVSGNTVKTVSARSTLNSPSSAAAPPTKMVLWPRGL